MACDGPSQKYAFKVADEITEKIKVLLEEQSVTVDGIPVIDGLAWFAKARAKQEENFAALQNLVREIVWHDHASSW